MARSRRCSRLEQLADEAEQSKRCIVGMSNKDAACLYRAHKAGNVLSPAPHLYVRDAYWTSLTQKEQALHVLRAVQYLHPNWVFAGPSAALVYGLSVSYAQLKQVFVATGRNAHSKSRTSIVRIIVENDKPTIVNDLRVTSIERTVYDCLRIMDFTHGLAVADSALHRKGWSRKRLLTVIDEMPKRHQGHRHALATAQFADARAESGGESMARARMLLFGYEMPDLQVKVPNVVEGGNYFGDFGWKMPDGTLLVGELDGHDKYVDPEMTGGKNIVEVMTDERLRESRVSAARATVMRFSFKDMMDDFRFTRILDAYHTPRATLPHYQDEDAPFVPTCK